jgi:xanthine dehydrogenase small subunit
LIRFLHRQREVTLHALPAETTVLEYLREHCGLTGTKEGCASGDCGACTVVTAKATDDGIRYEPVNACIAPLGSLHGKQLISVEDLKDGATWHPVQRAMIESHASQCGFCTPGFVMSLFALYHNAANATREDILEALGGNLCRCTGYRPIVDAAERVLGDARSDQFTRATQATLDQLRAIQDTQSETLALATEHSAYFRPSTIDAVAQLLTEHPDCRLLAGGTDLFLESTQILKPLPRLIDLRAVPELARISVDDNWISLGAAVTHQESLAAVLPEYPELSELIERFGALQVRSQGTVAGNIANASPIGDWPPVLLALGGRLRLHGASGTRELSLDEFFIDYRKTALDPGEFISHVLIPRRKDEVLLRAYKISKRYEDDISSVCAVFALTLEGNRISTARVAFGGMAATPKRALHCEESLIGQDLRSDSLSIATALAQDYAPISDARASSDYRTLVAAKLLERLQHEYLGEYATRTHQPQHGSNSGATHG